MHGIERRFNPLVDTVQREHNIKGAQLVPFPPLDDLLQVAHCPTWKGVGLLARMQNMVYCDIWRMAKIRWWGSS